MTKSLENKKRLFFAFRKTKVKSPSFLDIQLKYFKKVFQLETKYEDRKNEELFKNFSNNFPLSDNKNKFKLEFIDYFLGYPLYSLKECIERGMTFSVPLKVRLRLYCKNPKNQVFKKDVIQDVYLGSIPYMTPTGSFIINGSERVLVSQLHRAQGVFFSKLFTSNKGIKLYSAKVIPFKGNWLEFSIDMKNVMYVSVDLKKQIPITTFLRAIGFETNQEILETLNFYKKVKVNKFNINKLIGYKLYARVLKKWVEEFVDKETGELIYLKRTQVILEKDLLIERYHLHKLKEYRIESVLIYKKKKDYYIIENTLKKDPTHSGKEAVQLVYKILKNTDAPDEETARSLIENFLFDEKKYSLGKIGRYILNNKLKINISKNIKSLTKEDIILIIKYLMLLANKNLKVDDMDNLSHRYVRTVVEQLYSQFNIGLERLASIIQENLNLLVNEAFTPIQIINYKILASAIHSFFCTNPLSQFMDQTNPLSEITHKRRLSSVGKGGLSSERAGLDVRDVHYSNYGRICPIETSEGQNIGLISSLCGFAQLNNLGLLETIYRPVKKGKVHPSDTVYLTAEKEKNIATANSLLNDKGNFIHNRIFYRRNGDILLDSTEKIAYIDIANNQLASISASLIPFMEHDDANRALMGSNMMRQAIPLLLPESPIVGTGLEEKVVSDSRLFIHAESDGIVDSLDSTQITIRYHRTEEEKLISFDSDFITYQLIKTCKTNQKNSISLKPIVKSGIQVKKGQVLCEGYATKNGELALGINLLAAFMPWKGYNFEDALILSERVVKEDLFTSIHIEEYSLEIRETKFGMEEFTNDLPNLSEEAKTNLDPNGIIRVGVEVKPGDILLGKMTPKEEEDPTPEEKLLRAIFGEKVGKYKDSSFKSGPSLYGVVIGKKLFYRSTKKTIKKEKIYRKYKNEFVKLHNKLCKKLSILLQNKISKGVYNDLKKNLIPKGIIFTKKIIEIIKDYRNIYIYDWTLDKETNRLVSLIMKNYKIKIREIQDELKRKKLNYTSGITSGIIKMVKVYIAKKRKLKVGDKMSGRHGNKGVVAKIVRNEDMPFLEDGTQVDILLTPLGVPSRLNIGQIYETILGWAGQKLKKNFENPILDGATIEQIYEYTEQSGLPRFGYTYLYDGETGERFDQPATVGIIYLIKLGQMVEDKIHARSTGPYSLITQQPLGGKSKFGGQRFGEMEVWALEAYGASNILREMLTIKSDDVLGRSKTYEAIVKGSPIPDPIRPESFNVLLHELQGLGFEIKMEE